METVNFKPLLSPDFIVRTLHLKVQILSRPHLPFTHVTTDSRLVIPGSLFVALKGEKYDGIEFIEQAIFKKARGILCKRGTAIGTHKDVCIFQVEDPLSAYRKIAGAWRKEFSIPMIAIAGSAGKTTTKEFLSAILQGKWSAVHKTQGSQNGFIGIPMTLLDLKQEHEAAVIEVGIDDVGTMQQHMSLISAGASVLTTIGPEHLEKLRDIPTVAREEGIALSFVARTGGMIAVNLDDPWIRPHVLTIREGRKIPYSLQGIASNMDMISGYLSPNGKDLIFQGLGIQETKLALPLLGQHNASNLLAAIAIAAGLGLTGEEIQKGILFFKGAEGRSEIRKLSGSTTVICDYYNAQPASMDAGLELLSQITAQSNKGSSSWACLADMLELGSAEERYHRNLAEKILNLKIKNVLLFGTRMLALQDELEKIGFLGNCTHFESHSEMASTLTEGLKTGDTILIKGSRSMKMEAVWKFLEDFTNSYWIPES